MPSCYRLVTDSYTAEVENRTSLRDFGSFKREVQFGQSQMNQEPEKLAKPRRPLVAKACMHLLRGTGRELTGQTRRTRPTVQREDTEIPST